MAIDPNSLSYERNTLHAADFNASRDDDTSLSAGTVGEIAEAEVGDTATLSQYQGVFVGQPASNATGDRKGNEVYMKLQSGGGDVADTVQWAFAARNKGELGGGKQGSITGFITHRGQDNADPAQRRPMNTSQPVVPDGRLLTLLAKDETSSVTVDLSESEFELPIMGGK